MSFIDAVRSILGIKPVTVGELEARVARHPYSPGGRDHTLSQEDISDIEVIPEYSQTRSVLHAGAPLLFVTGGAGTGKSTLIRYLRSTVSAPIAVVAPTGVAALNAGGATIHSLFRLPPKVIQSSDIKRVRDRRLYTKLKFLVVDEVSMVRPDLLDGVDRFLRINREKNAPFGGVQVLLIGDLFQLPPVVPQEERQALRQMRYATDFFFSARSVASMPLVPVLLNRMFRQQDPEFVELLNRIRTNRDVDRTVARINARANQPPPDGAHELILTGTNRQADSRNERELARLPARSRIYNGSITGEFKVEQTKLPSPMNLELKVGAQVMFTKNGTAWVNGTVGRVVETGDNSVRVEITDGGQANTVSVAPSTWDKYRYKYDPSLDTIVAEVAGRYTQLPLTLAWAVTIHKAQGQTLKRILVDLGSGAFAPGQVYVALSRVRSLDHLRLARPLRPEEIATDEAVATFYKSLGEMTAL